jgi:hypothetical protein
MKTTLLIGVVSSILSRYRLAATTCSIICAVDRLASKPIRPTVQAASNGLILAELLQYFSVQQTMLGNTSNTTKT